MGCNLTKSIYDTNLSFHIIHATIITSCDGSKCLIGKPHNKKIGLWYHYMPQFGIFTIFESNHNSHRTFCFFLCHLPAHRKAFGVTWLEILTCTWSVYRKVLYSKNLCQRGMAWFNSWNIHQIYSTPKKWLSRIR